MDPYHFQCIAPFVFMMFAGGIVCWISEHL